MVAEPLFTPVSFLREDEEVRYAGGSLIIYGRNGVGKSLLLEAIASSLQGEIVGRAETGYVIAEDEGLLGVIARLRDGANAEDIQVLHPPPGHYPYDQVEEIRQAIDATRSRETSGIENSEVAAVVGEMLDEFASLRHVFLAPLPADLGPGWRLHAAALPSPAWLATLKARGLLHAPVGDNEVFPFTSLDDPELVTAYRYNGHKPHVVVHPSVFGRVIDDSHLDVASITQKWLGGQANSRSIGGTEFEGATLDSMRSRAEEWAGRANQLLSTLMADPPHLTFEFGDPADWLLGGSPGWPGIGRRSFAERRWAELAIALTAATDDVPFLIIDEPERGLHRAAEAYLAEGLRNLASNGSLRLIAATHSPEFVDTDFGQLIHLERGQLGPREFMRSEVEELRAVGLQPTSLLSRDRGYLLVEGEHDKQIFDGYFADDLRDLRVKVLAMRGAKNLMSVFDSEFLIDATDALLMPLLDDISLEPLYDVWAAAEAATIDGQTSAAVSVIKRKLRTIPGKAKEIYEPFLIGAITRGDGRRFFPLGMSKKDVLEYLPVEELVPGAESWESLRKEWSRSPASVVDRSGRAYKDWLRKVKHADLTPENLRFVAETTGPPPELKAIVAKVAERIEPGVSRSG